MSASSAPEDPGGSAGSSNPTLAALYAEQLERAAPDALRLVTEEIGRRHGDAVVATIFYGSCLRRSTTGGVIDLIVLVDQYRRAYAYRRATARRCLAVANALLPPNVFYLEVGAPAGTLRVKYSVISTRDFERAVEPACLHSFVWARMCQPTLLVEARDAAAREVVVRGAESSALTIVACMLAQLPVRDGRARFSAAQLWALAFRHTYRAEWRVESQATIDALYADARDHYDRVLGAALRALERRGALEHVREGRLIEVAIPVARRRRWRRAWALRRPLGKALAATRLLKNALIFGDWVPYVLWKMERHSGVRIEATERQRRHPFVWGWPVLLRVLRRRTVR